MTEWTWRLRATLDEDSGKITKMVVEDERGPDDSLMKDWAQWDAEHPYVRGAGRGSNDPTQHLEHLSDGQRAGAQEGVDRVRQAAATDPDHEHGLLVAQDGTVGNLVHGDEHSVQVIGASKTGQSVEGSVEIHSHPESMGANTVASRDDAHHVSQWGLNGQVVVGSGKHADEYHVLGHDSTKSNYTTRSSLTDTIDRHVNGSGSNQSERSDFKTVVSESGGQMTSSTEQDAK